MKRERIHTQSEARELGIVIEEIAAVGAAQPSGH
jgi:hypothetical protein